MFKGKLLASETEEWSKMRFLEVENEDQKRGGEAYINPYRNIHLCLMLLAASNNTGALSEPNYEDEIIAWRAFYRAPLDISWRILPSHGSVRRPTTSAAKSKTPKSSEANKACKSLRLLGRGG